MGRRVKEGTTKGYKETFEDDGFMHYLDCGDSFMGVQKVTKK